MLDDVDRLILPEVQRWLEAAVAVCGLLRLDDEILDRQPEVYLRTVAEAQAQLPELLQMAPLALATLERYLQRLPRES